MVNENRFWFDHKNFFNFWKTIYGSLKTVNHFPKLNSSSLHACLIFDCRNLAMVGRQNPGGAGIRQHPTIGILPGPESGDIWPPSPDAGKPNSGRNWPESGHGLKPVGSGQKWSESGRI
jgi:hypothetical protein